MSLSLSNYTSTPLLTLTTPTHPIHDAYCGIPFSSLNHTRTLSLPSFPLYECGSCVSICHTYSDDTNRDFTKCIDVLVADAHPFEKKLVSVGGQDVEAVAEVGVEVGEQLYEELYEELGWGFFGVGEPEYKMVKMSTVALERCAGVWDEGVMEGKVPQGQFGILAEMGDVVSEGGKDVVEEAIEKAAAKLKGRKMVKRVSKFARSPLRVNDTNSAEEIKDWHAAYYSVEELLKSGASEAEAEVLCGLDWLREGTV